MRNDIREKLQVELSKKIETEAQVVYILSRIRKIIEIDDSKRQFGKLKFYCDWALHAQIENIKPMKVILQSLIANPSAHSFDFLSFNQLDGELKSFLEKENILTSAFMNKTNQQKFKTILYNIYSDTPLILEELNTVLFLNSDLFNRRHEYKLHFKLKVNSKKRTHFKIVSLSL